MRDEADGLRVDGCAELFEEVKLAGAPYEPESYEPEPRHSLKEDVSTSSTRASKEVQADADSEEVSPVSPLRKVSKVLFSGSVEVSVITTATPPTTSSRTLKELRESSDHVRPFGGRKTCAGFSLGGTLTLDPASGIADSKRMRKRRHLS
jgi:hypothetical protein